MFIAWVLTQVPCIAEHFKLCSFLGHTRNGVVRGTVSFPSQPFNRNHTQATYSGTLVRKRAFNWRRKAATAVAGALALGMAYGVMFGHNGLTVFARKRQEERNLHQQMQQLQRENSRLREHVDRLQNDPGAIEHQAREALHYTRSGEVIYTLPTPVPAHATAVPNE